MSNPLILEFDSETGESVTREMDSAEFERYEAGQAKQAGQVAEADAAATQRADLLARLGITADEAKLLFL